MALKLPGFFKGKKEESAEDLSFDLSSIQLDTAALEQIQAAPSSPAAAVASRATESNPNATLIGEAIQRSSNISLPLIGKLPLQQQVQYLLFMLGGAVILGSVSVWMNASHSNLTSTQTQIAGDMLMHSQRIGKASPNAIQGKVEAFTQLKDSRKEFNSDLNSLIKGEPYQGRSIDPPDANMASVLKDTQTAWSNSDKAADTI